MPDVACRAAEEILKEEVARQDELLEEAENLQQELVAAHNCTKNLREEILKQNKYIELLKVERSHLRREVDYRRVFGRRR